MALYSSKSDWLDKLETVKKLLEQDPNLSSAALTDQLGVSKAETSNLTTLNDLLDPAAIQKIRAATPKISLKSALALAGLKKAKPENLTALVHTALDVVLARRLPTLQIKALVAGMAQGHPANSFEPETGKGGKAREKTTKAQNRPTPVEGRLAELFKQVEASTGEDKIKAQAQLVAYVAGQPPEEEGESSPQKPSGISASKRTPKASSRNPTDWFWEMLLGVKFVSQLRSRAKKGQLTTTDKVLVLLYFLFYKPFEVIFLFLWKLTKGTAKELGHWLKHTLGKTFSQIIQWAVPLLIIAALLWGAGKVYQFAIVNPLHWLEGEIKSGFHWGGSTAQVAPTPAPVAATAPTAPPAVRSEKLESAKLKTSNSSLRTSNSAPKVTYQPSISFNSTASPTNTSGTLYDPKILELEIAAIPANSVIKDYVFQPDEGMPADLAVSRLQDLTDADKYTMMIGGGKQKILSVTPSNTNFIIAYKSTDLFGVFGSSSGTMNIFLEDVLYIHINETDHFSKPGAQPDIQYQCTVVAKGAKYPLTIQCASADDLENLVSTLEYFIRHSRLGRDAQPAGMPYPHQGLMFDNDCVVEKIWAGSPADKAGIGLTDHLWSVGKETADQQEKKDFEKGLQSSAPVVYVVSPAEWERALTAARVPGQSAGFRPKLRKVVLPIT